MVVSPRVTEALSPYLTGLRLFYDSWRQTSRVSRKAVSNQSPVIRNSLACVAKWRKVVAKILNMFKKFMRRNSSQNGRNHFGTRHICEINKTELRTNCDINETLRDNIASKLN